MLSFLSKITGENLMNLTGFSKPQILAFLPQAEGGVPELCREYGMRGAPRFVDAMFGIFEIKLR